MYKLITILQYTYSGTGSYTYDVMCTAERGKHYTQCTAIWNFTIGWNIHWRSFLANWISFPVNSQSAHQDGSQEARGNRTLNKTGNVRRT